MQGAVGTVQPRWKDGSSGLATGRPVLGTFDLPKCKAQQGTQCESEELWRASHSEDAVCPDGDLRFSNNFWVILFSWEAFLFVLYLGCLGP